MEEPMTRITLDIQSPDEDFRGKQLCLNMIVKNESRVIRRLLESVGPYIDCYCICDTGSTDDTIEIIQSFFEEKYPNYPGKIIHEPFRDFGYNRTFAIQACEQLDVKYILLMDADMILKCPSNSIIAHLDDVHDAYYLYQGSSSYYYKNTRIVRNHRGITYWGVTHEYVKTPDNTRYKQIESGDVFINDIGDGGAKTDKYERDIRLLKQGLIDHPNNDRYTFYLANSQRDAGHLQDAIESYKQRIQIGGWKEEVWQSYFNIGKCYKTLNDWPNALHWWLEGYNYHPERVENMHEIIHHYRVNGKNRLGFGIFNMCADRLKNCANQDYLFYQRDVYEYKMHYELTIVGYYCQDLNPKYNYSSISMHVLQCPYAERSILNNVISNYKFYCPKLSNVCEKTELSLLSHIRNVCLTQPDPSFKTSTPCVYRAKDDWYVVVRHVNYYINADGTYGNPGTISTQNLMAKIGLDENGSYRTIYETVLYTPKTAHLEENCMYKGNEDVRLFYSQKQDKLLMNANRGVFMTEPHNTHHIKVEHGIVSDNESGEIDSLIIEFPGREQLTEKNWVLFEDLDTGKLKVVYKWHPLIIGELESDKVKETHDFGHENTPACLKSVRGSTNGVLIDGEWWFLCHLVSYEDRRYYYHMFVVLDPVTCEVKRYSKYFTFEGAKVEYTLGFGVDNWSRFIIGYSVMDSTTKYMAVQRSNINALFPDNGSNRF